MNMTTPTQPAELLALAEILGGATDTTDSGLPATVAECLGVMHAAADELRALAAHRGEVGDLAVGRVQRAGLGYYAMLLPGVGPPRVKEGDPLFTHPPQAQAGAGDALEDAMLAKAYRQESAAFAADSEISVGAKIERRYRELLAAALEASHASE